MLHQLASAGTMVYRFNLPWNASDVTFGSIPGVSDDDWSAVSEIPADGAGFTLSGAIEKPGTYTLPVTVTDEFGGPHVTAVTFDVVGPSATCAARRSERPRSTSRPVDARGAILTD